MRRCRLLVLNAALVALDYRVPDGMEVCHGSVVIAPLGPRKVLGIVWEEEQLPAKEVPDSRLRALLEVLPVPPLTAPLRHLMAWTADYYCASLAQVARMALSSREALDGGRMMTEYRLARPQAHPEELGQPTHQRLTPQRKQAIERLAETQGTIRELAAVACVSEAVLRAMVSADLLEAVIVEIARAYPLPEPNFSVPPLSTEQQAVADLLIEAVRRACTQDAMASGPGASGPGASGPGARGTQESGSAERVSREKKTGGFAPFLLDGVTGSGKTEVYFEAMAEALRHKRQVLVLLPEIALTQNFLRRFAVRFGAEPVLWHSSLKASERRRAWRAVADGSAKVVVGARSALFLPFARLGLIVVDEAHEASFKQDEGVRYNGRDASVIRAQLEAVPIILASATPALESLHFAEMGIYRKLDLPQRFGGASLPAIHLVDLTKTLLERGHWLAPPLVKAMGERLERAEQSLLFLNRRGYAPLILCRHCGYRFQCGACSAWLVEHRLSRRLACHHCGFEQPVPDTCPECGKADCLVACGPGVERIADEVAGLFPDARIALATSDTLNTADKLAHFVDAAQSGAIDIIVGTQLVTKGYHFPRLTLVGVIDADLGLEGGDLRAGERSWQQIAQVAGRAGRAERPGEVLIQTRNPASPVIAALAKGDRDGFYAAETQARRTVGAPPFGRWAAIIVSSEDEAEARDAARAIGAARPKLRDMAVLGPAPAPMSLLRGRYRYRLLVNARRSVALQKVVRHWLGSLALPPSVRVSIDIDPYSFV